MLRRTATLALAIAVAFTGMSVRADDHLELADFPFWQKMAGWWASENTYFTADMDYTVRGYNSLVHIELDGPKFTEREHRFYPAGIATTRYGQGLMGPDEGIELVIVTTGELIDDKGTLGNIRMDHSSGPFDPAVTYNVLGAEDGVRVRPNAETGIDTYRMYFNFTTPDRRFRSNFGLIYGEGEDDGGLRAFILYRDKRMQRSDFAAKRAEFRARHNVQVISRADPDNPGKSKVTRLD